MSARVSNFIGMVVIAVFLIAAWASGSQGGMLTAMIGAILLAPVFMMLLGRFLRGEE